MKIWILFCVLILSAGFARAQRAVEVGGTYDASFSPNKQVYVSYFEPLPDGFRSYSTASFWQFGPGQIAHSVVTGIERPLFSRGWFALSSHAQAGYALAGNATSGNFSGGGAIIIDPPFLRSKNAAFVITGSATDVPATGAWYPRLSVGIRYGIGAPTP